MLSVLLFQNTVDEQIEKMLELLTRRDDEHFEGFCKALEANDQRGVVERYLQKHLVRCGCCYVLSLNC